MATLILLDRDGVINRDSPEYVKSAAEWIPLPGALQAIADLKRAGFLVAVCTNQAGIGRGIVTEGAVLAIHGRLHADLEELGVALDGIVYCPHHPDDHCSCRKPAPGLLLTMMERLGVDAADTICVGDSLRDIEAARAAGCCSVLVRTGNGLRDEENARAAGADHVVADLARFARDAIAGTIPC